MKEHIYTHFHPEEHAFIDQAADWIERAYKRHTVKRTDFLDPRQQLILQTLVNRCPEVQLRLDGGYDMAERRRALIAPEYMWLDDEDPGIQVVAVRSDDARFGELDHGDFLGAILGLGIKREKIGDIHVHETVAHCLAAGEIAAYIDMNLRQVHRVRVLTEILPVDQLLAVTPVLEEMRLAVSSLRVDAVASDALRLSRTKIAPLIRAGKCRVNWKKTEDPAQQLAEGDVVSVRGFGRFKVLNIEGLTKKGKIRVVIGKFA